MKRVHDDMNETISNFVQDITDGKNMSASKLAYSPFNELVQSEETDSRPKRAKLSSETKRKAIRGNVIMDKELLSECISKSEICSTCKKSKSKLEFWKINKNNGLHFWKQVKR